MIVVIGLMRQGRRLHSGPDLICRGFALPEAELDEMKNIVSSILKNYEIIKSFDRDEIVSAVKKAMKKYLFKHHKKAPMILPIVMEH